MSAEKAATTIGTSVTTGPPPARVSRVGLDPGRASWGILCLPIWQGGAADGRIVPARASTPSSWSRSPAAWAYVSER